MSNRKALFVSEDCHQKIKTIASMEGQSIIKWVEWVTNMAYEAAMHNRGRKGLTVVK